MVRSIIISFATLALGGCGLIIDFEDHVASESDAGGALEECAEFAEADFGERLDIDVRVKAFMRAAGSFKVLGEAMVAEVSTACVNIAKAAGRDESAWTGKGGLDLVEAACAEASAGIDAVFKAAGMLSINILVEGGRCEASLEASAACNAQCDVSGTCTPGELEAKCEPGQLAGTCSAECSGACEASGGVAVECKGSCSAVCEGNCVGECDVKGAGGACAGRCFGFCNGTCSGSCELESDAKVECQGTCRGDCSVAFTAPHCEGKFEPPMCDVDADCSANCNASVQAEAKCTPPKVTYEIVGGVQMGELTALVNVLQVELPKLLVNAVDRGQAIADSAEAVQASADGVIVVAGTSGKAFACATAAASAALTASVNVSVSFQASASVSGKASPVPTVACGCAVYITDPTGCTEFTSGSEDLYNAYRDCVCSMTACGTGSPGAECADNACAATPKTATPACETCTITVSMGGGACQAEFVACSGDI